MTQIKRSRPLLLLTIISLFLVVPFATACSEILSALVSTDTAGIVDGIEFGPEDILAYDVESEEWSLFFDGSEYGLQPGKHDIEAIAFPSPTTDPREIYLSFYQNKVKVDGVGAVTGQDVIKFTESTTPSASYSYELYFDGSDVGLSTVGEKIDGLEVFLPTESVKGSCPAALLGISTLGQYSIPAKFAFEGNKLTGDGSDVLLFCATNLGQDTAGFWIKYFDGRDKGMPKNYLSSLSLPIPLSSFPVIFTTPGDFALDDALGGHSDVYAFRNGEFNGPEFRPADTGLTEFVDGLHLVFCGFC